MTSMHSANDVGEATHPSQWMHTGIDGVRVVGVHRRVEDTGRDRVDPYSVRREFNAERLRGRRQAALGRSVRRAQMAHCDQQRLSAVASTPISEELADRVRRAN